MSVIIRFGYCPPNPGPKKKLKNKWYSNINQAIDEYDGISEYEYHIIINNIAK